MDEATSNGTVLEPLRAPRSGLDEDGAPSDASELKGLTVVRLVALNAAIVIAYVVAAFLGFRLAFVAEQVTTVWAPTGIALAALLTGGLRLWPAVWIGALLTNASTNAPLWTAGVIATGNTLEAVVAVWWLRRVPGFQFAFQRVVDVVAFLPIAAVGCTAISATLGVTALCLGGVQPWDRFLALWFDWWLGDALGAVVVAPAILAALTHRWAEREGVRAMAWIAGTTLVTHVVFGQLFGETPHPLEYIVFPLIVGAAVTGGARLTSLVVLTAAIVSIWDTVHGSGPFASAHVHYSLILLQAFMGVMAGTSLLLAAAIAERQATEHREKDAATELRTRGEMLRLAQRAGGVATFEWDFRNQVARCSAEFFAIFGLPARDGVMLGAEWAGFVHPDDRERMGTHLTRALQGTEAAAADYRITAKDGTVRWLSYAGQIETTPNGERLLGTVVDISERKRLEAELRRHAAEVERILASIGEGFVALDHDFRYVYVNRAAEEMLGQSRNDLLGRVLWNALPEEMTGEGRPQLEEAASKNVPSRFESFVSGSNRWFESRVYPSPDGLSVFFADVTGRKRAEIALQEAKTAAESANQLKDQFLATLSHELRTPLNAILGYARMLQTNMIAPEKRLRAIEVIERNAVAQNQLVEDLLDMSRITTGKIRLDPVPVPVAAVVREAVEGVKPAADAKRIELVVDLDPFAGSVRGDGTRLQQIFWNLLTNAVKFTGDGGRIVTSLRRQGPHVEIVVSDTGTGISADFLPFVFEPFRQAENRFDRVHGGLGLGLAITRQLVELHGGTIRAASDGAGRGATFTVLLPCVSNDGEDMSTAVTQPKPATLLPPMATTLADLKVLLVDDEDDTLTLFRDALEDAGAQVRASSTAQEALREAAEWRPDLLVADLGLPGMDGYELLKAIRALHPQLNCPAVAVSAYARLDDRTRARAAGFEVHIAKPVDPASLVAALRTALSAS